MAEETDNLVLRLLREIRTEQTAQRRTMDGIGGRMTTLERKMDDVNESVGYALGMSAHANVAYETTGKRLDRLTDRIDRIEGRLEGLKGEE